MTDGTALLPIGPPRPSRAAIGSRPRDARRGRPATRTVARRLIGRGSRQGPGLAQQDRQLAKARSPASPITTFRVNPGVRGRDRGAACCMGRPGGAAEAGCRQHSAPRSRRRSRRALVRPWTMHAAVPRPPLSAVAAAGQSRLAARTPAPRHTHTPPPRAAAVHLLAGEGHGRATGQRSPGRQPSSFIRPGTGQ